MLAGGGGRTTRGWRHRRVGADRTSPVRAEPRLREGPPLPSRTQNLRWSVHSNLDGSHVVALVEVECRCNEMVKQRNQEVSVGLGPQGCAEGQAGVTTGSLPLTLCLLISIHPLDTS